MRWALPVVLCLVAATAWAGEAGSTTLGIPNALWLPLNLGVFLFVLYRLVGRPMGRFLESRREGIAAELEAARRKVEEAEQARAVVLRRLEEVEREVAELERRAEREGRAEADRIAEQAEAETQRFLRRVEEEIDRKGAETRQALAADAAALTASLARDLLEREVDAEDRRRVFERSLDALGSLGGRS